MSANRSVASRDRGSGQASLPRGLTLRAHAKINLGLEILGRRPDGFHEITSVTALVSLHDNVEVHPADALNVVTIPAVVSAEENLARLAALRLANASSMPARARITVHKRIPLAAGLGGGSSDAAAALRLLGRLWQVAGRRAVLAQLASQLGSDVSLFLGGPACLIEGRGERVSPLPAPLPTWMVLACPEVAPANKTRALYAALTAADWSDGTATRALAATVQARRPIPAEALVNAFDAAADAVYPDYRAFRSALTEAAGVPVHLTGAGPTLFSLHPSRNDAIAAAGRMRSLGLPVHIVRTLARRPSIRLRTTS